MTYFYYLKAKWTRGVLLRTGRYNDGLNKSEKLGPQSMGVHYQQKYFLIVLCVLAQKVNKYDEI